MWAQKEKQKRLRKYDVAHLPGKKDASKDKLRHYFELDWDISVDSVLQALKSSESAEGFRFTKLMSIIGELFNDEETYHAALYNAMLGGGEEITIFG